MINWSVLHSVRLRCQWRCLPGQPDFCNMLTPNVTSHRTRNTMVGHGSVMAGIQGQTSVMAGIQGQRSVMTGYKVKGQLWLGYKFKDQL